MKKILYTLPVASTDFTKEASLDCSGVCPVVRYGYCDGGKEVCSGIAFRAVYAIRYRVESCCNVWHIEDAYDALVEVGSSSWKEEIRKDVPDVFKPNWKPRHFMIYFDSAGCFEFLAEDWEVLSESI